LCIAANLPRSRLSTPASMDSASAQIRHAMRVVEDLRQQLTTNASLARAVHEIKAIQARRFACTYQDLLISPVYKGCASFFLTELYSERDYGQRDRQFAKIATAIELALPQPVITTAVDLARLHQVTETLDVAMAQHWLQETTASLATRYQLAWRALDRRTQRQWQLTTVVGIGEKLGELTRRRGLRLLLKMMRQPAEIAGLGELQSFLETGFDRFSQIAKSRETLNGFLGAINARESDWIDALDSADKAEAQALITNTFERIP